MMQEWMIYGANGFTGQLIAREAIRRGHRPLLAGRSEEVRALARELGLASRVFGLDNGATEGLRGMKAVLHCAGPFSRTARPLIDACLRAGTHYLDITGEAPVFEDTIARGPEAQRAGVTLLPGVGYDVVASDCLAAMLRADIEGSPVSLQLAFASNMGVSSGTARTALELFDEKIVRRDGRLVPAEDAFRSFRWPIRSAEKFSVCQRITWGDVATAALSTGAPNIDVYMAAPRAAAWLMRWVPTPGLRRKLFGLAFGLGSGRRSFGPSAEKRGRSRVHLWGRLESDRGERVERRLRVIDGYDFTVLSALAAVEKLFRGNIPAGVLTPSMAFGAKFVLEIPGSVMVD